MSKPFPTTITGKLEYAAKLKDEGNELFKDQNYKKAILYVLTFSMRHFCYNNFQRLNEVIYKIYV